MTPGTLTFRRLGDVEVAVLSGEVDIAGAPGLTERLFDRIAAGRALIVDVAQVTYLDSGGVRLLDRIAGHCRERGVPFAVVAPRGGPARTVLEICAFPAGLVADVTAEALEAVQRR